MPAASASETNETRISGVFLSTLPLVAEAEGLLRNHQLSVAIRAQDGSYEIRRADGEHPVLRAIVGARVNHHWVKCSDYPSHQVRRSDFMDAIGNGQQLTVTFAGVAGQPTLRYVVRLYDDLPFGDVEVEVRNQTAKAMTVQSIRNLEAMDRAASARASGYRLDYWQPGASWRFSKASRHWSS